MQKLLQLNSELQNALEAGQAVVALESTVIAHGLPYPTNVKVARRMEDIVRAHGAIPATIAVLSGRPRVGLDDDELEHLATAAGIRKVSRRDLPVVVAQAGDGATTVASTATIAAWAGIEVFATGGIGGVHRDAEYDISNDLPTLASVPVAVVCAGAKSILDLRATLEWLETAGVTVVGYGTDEFPAFYSIHSGLPVDVRVGSPREAAAIIRASRQMGLPGGTLIAVPVPAAHELPAEYLASIIASALDEASSQGIEGSATTPFLLKWIAENTGGASLRANVALLENNAAVAAQIAVALKEPALRRSASQPWGQVAGTSDKETRDEGSPTR
jgi:pseudouridine-5'-phosphate glycosidase